MYEEMRFPDPTFAERFCTASEWNGYLKLDFSFAGRKAVLVLPHEPDPARRWLYKTEYFGAFPAFELEMLSRGWFVAHLENRTRWCPPEDTDDRPAFCAFLREKFGLNEKCLPVGMSCGGMEAIYFAAKYPAYVAALYLDAPVVNLLSCPCGVGISREHPAHERLYREFVEKRGMTTSDLINYREHPRDHLGELTAAKIPLFLVCGDADMTVPYPENGALLVEAYRAAGADLTLVLKPGCDHHPHGLSDHAPLIAFAESRFPRKNESNE